MIDFTNAIEVLNEVASKTDLETIYYLKVEDVNDKKLKVIFTYLDEDLMTDKEILNIPIVLFIVDGKVISYNQGTLFSQRDPYIELDEFQIQGLSEIYYYGINDVISWENLKKK